MSIKNTKCNAQSIYQIKYVTCANVLQDLKLVQGAFSNVKVMPIKYSGILRTLCDPSIFRTLV